MRIKIFWKIMDKPLFQGAFSLSVIIILGCWLVSCASTPDRSYLDGTICDAPCWEGINPGSTEEAKALDILESLDFIRTESIRCEDSTSYDKRRICSFTNVQDRTSNMIIVDGVVALIVIDPDSKLTLSETIDSFGEPQFLTVAYTGQEEYCSRVVVYYIEGIIVTAYQCSHDPKKVYGANDTISVSGDMQVDILSFAQGNEDLGLLLSNALYTSQSILDALSKIQQWKGFGYYHEK